MTGVLARRKGTGQRHTEDQVKTLEEHKPRRRVPQKKYNLLTP